MLPYNIVEKQGFLHLMKTVAPTYVVPSRKTIAENKVPILYEKTKNKIKEDFLQMKYVSLTTDCWTSCANDPYISLTAHYINMSWHLKSCCLNCQSMMVNHTGENIADVIANMLKDWNIKEVVAYTTDSGANILKAMNYIGKNHISCFGHTINTAVNKAMNRRDLNIVVEKIQKLLNALSHSWKMKRDLKEIQKKLDLPVLQIPSFSKTRWWSLLKTMEIFTTQHLALTQLFDKTKYRSTCLTIEEVDTL